MLRLGLLALRDQLDIVSVRSIERSVETSPVGLTSLALLSLARFLAAARTALSRSSTLATSGSSSVSSESMVMVSIESDFRLRSAARGKVKGRAEWARSVSLSSNELRARKGMSGQERTRENLVRLEHRLRAIHEGEGDAKRKTPGLKLDALKERRVQRAVRLTKVSRQDLCTRRSDQARTEGKFDLVRTLFCGSLCASSRSSRAGSGTGTARCHRC